MNNDAERLINSLKTKNSAEVQKLVREYLSSAEGQKSRESLKNLSLADINALLKKTEISNIGKIQLDEKMLNQIRKLL